MDEDFLNSALRTIIDDTKVGHMLYHNIHDINCFHITDFDSKIMQLTEVISLSGAQNGPFS